ncbi:recombinase family protein [Candidatus Saccharibacteria bacterium]|nr:recombinase family protein [Candidatus Saccharibacteria bacterium]
MTKQILAITNCRVSSAEQLQNNSLSRQHLSVQGAADKLGATIVKQWSGSMSSKRGTNVDRPDIKEMMAFCKQNKQVKYLIVDEPDRFMRSVDEAIYFEVVFKQLGVKVWYASDPILNGDDPSAKLLKFSKYFSAEGSNDERIHKSVSGQTTALMQGRYTFSPKPGYMKGVRVGIPEIHPVRGQALRDVLIKIAEHRVTPTQGLIELNKSNYTQERAPLKMDKFRKIATDPFYAGITEINKQVKVRNEEALHDPLITKTQHKELLMVFAGKKKNQTGPRKNGNPEYILNTITVHDTCLEIRNKGKFVGFQHSNGKNPNLVYKKYRCRSCKLYVKRDELHSKVAQLFADNPISDKGIRDLSEALDTVWKRNDAQAKQESVRISRQIDSLRQDIDNRALAAIDPSNKTIKPEILANIEKMKADVAEYEKQLDALKKESDTDRQQFLDFAFDFVINMKDSFFTLTPDNAKKCKQIIFPAGFYMDDNKNVYTPEISPLIRLATSKKDTEVSSKARLVRVTGL